MSVGTRARVTSWLLVALAVLALTRLVACGGSGGSGSTTTTPVTSTTCTLTNNTTATATVTNGCALLSRDTSSCQATRTAQGLTGEWLKFSCRVTLTLSGQNVQISADSQPDYKSTYFPDGNACLLTPRTGAENPNRITARSIVMNVPLSPNTTSETMPLGTVGMAINAVPLFSNLAAPGDDIYLEAATFDSCGAHPQQQGVYHYHSEPYAISSNDGNLIGVMRDGYFVYGQKEPDGNVRTIALDAAGGHSHTTPASPVVPAYHYHANQQTSATTTATNKTQVFLTTGNYRGTPGSCTGC